MKFLSRIFNGGKTVPIEVPTDDRQVLEGVETWQVTWMARSGQFAGRADLTNCTSVGQLFTNEPAAREFEKALRDAFNLVKDTITPSTIHVGKA